MRPRLARTTATASEPRSIAVSVSGNDRPVPYLLGGVRWHGQPGFKLVAVKDVRRLTGLEPLELLRRPSIQQLTRIGKSGAREEFLRLPVELIIEKPTD